MWGKPYFLNFGSRLESKLDITEVNKSQGLVGGDTRYLGEVPIAISKALAIALQLHLPLPPKELLRVRN